MTAKSSGLSLTDADIPVVLGMAARGDRNHDIAAWFGVNQGRVAEAKKGDFGNPPIAAGDALPPKGPPGIKGRRVRAAVTFAVKLLNSGDAAKAQQVLEDAANRYDANET